MKGQGGVAAPERINVSTPENVVLPFEIAPAGSRLIAFILDSLVIAAALLVLVALAWLALPGGGSARDEEVDSGGYAAAIVMLASFFLRNFYFAASEIAWHGQTLGKRQLGLRVIARDGGPLTAEMIFARNLTRDLEVFLPLTVLYAPELLFGSAPGYARFAGVLWLLVVALLPVFNRHRARVGDLIAGTVVVLEPKAALLSDLVEQGRAPEAKRGPAREPSYTFTNEQLDVYGIKELQVLEDVLREGAPDPKLLLTISEKIRRKIGFRPPHGDLNPEAFLRAFYAAQRARLEHKMLLGKRQEEKVR